MPEERTHGRVIRNVAIATDFAPWSDRALQHAAAIARWYNAALHVVHAVRRSEFSLVPELMVSLEELAERDGENQIRRLHAAHTLDDIKPRIWNLNGELSTLGDFVQDHSIDLLVLGLSGRSVLSKILLGSVAQQIFHYVSCPVLTVGPWSRGAMKQLQLKNVLFATDLSSQSTAALPYVLSAAKAWRASIDVLHVCSPHRPDSELRMETYRRRLQTLTIGELHLSIRYHVLPGEPADVVLDFAGRNNGDLMVLGLSHDRSLYAGPSISQAYEIVRRALCPVLSVPTLSACGLGQ